MNEVFLWELERVHAQWFGGDDAPEWKDYKPEEPESSKYKYGYKTGAEYFGGKMYENDDQSVWNKFGDPTEAATKYSNSPVVFGYTDENGVWHTTKNLYTEASGLETLANQQIPSFGDWAAENAPGYQPDIQQSEPYQGIQQQINQLLNPERRQADWRESQEAAALGMGFEDAAGLTGAMQGEREGFERALTSPAFDEEFYRSYWNQAQAAMSELREENARLVEAISAEGRGGAYQARTQAIEGLNNEILKYQMGLVDREQLQRQAVFDSHLKIYNTYVQQGNALATDYYDRLSQDRMEAIKDYASQVTTIMEQNGQYLQKYGDELQRIKQHTDLTYQSIMASIGVDEALMSKAQAEYNLNMQPYLDQWQLALDEYQMDWEQWQAEEESNGNILETLFGAALIIIGAVLSPLVPPVGGAIAAGGVAMLTTQ
jgi:hypothetical protein